MVANLDERTHSVNCSHADGRDSGGMRWYDPMMAIS